MRQGVEEVVHADDYFVVLGADGFGDVAGMGEFAEFLLAIADGEGFDGPIHHGLHERGDGARIDAAREKHSQGHIAHQARAHGIFQAAAAFGDPGLVVAFFIGERTRDFPIALDFELFGSQSQPVSGHELADAGEQRLLVRAIAEVEVFGEQRFLEARRDGGVLQQRLDFGREGE